MSAPARLVAARSDRYTIQRETAPHRFPAIHPPAFRAAVDQVFGA